MLSAIFAQSNVLPATFAQTKVLPETLVQSNVLPATLVQSNVLHAPGGEISDGTLMSTVLLQVYEVRSPYCAEASAREDRDCAVLL